MSFWCFKNLDGKPAEPMRPDESKAPADGILDIDGEIVAEAGWFSEGAVVARDFRKALDRMRNVTVRINSPGGDVMAGAEIYSALKEHSLNGHGRVRVEITALAASAASVIAMAGDEIAMYPTSYMMIHNPWSIAIGDAKEMRKTARTLDVISEGLINAYQQRTGKTRDELKRMLENETWMSAGTAVEQGFADEVIGVAGQDAAPIAACLMSSRAHGIREILEKYGAMIRAEETEPEEEKPNEEPEETAERSENEPENLREDAEEGADPDKDDPEEANDPEEPEEGEDPEEPDDREAKDRIVKRCAAIAAYAETALRMMKEEFQ